jgi:hypothetical protein
MRQQRARYTIVGALAGSVILPGPGTVIGGVYGHALAKGKQVSIAHQQASIAAASAKKATTTRTKKLSDGSTIRATVKK